VKKQVAIPDSQHLEAARSQVGISAAIMVVVHVLTTVELHNQFCFEACEVGDVAANRYLSAKLEAD
jgi:hypothetical protein